MNVSEMPAGRELDALVAEKVMGIDRWKIYDCDMVGSPSDNYQEWIREENVLFYSTDIAAAWQVWNKLPRQTPCGSELSVGIEDGAPIEGLIERGYVVYAKRMGTTQYGGAGDTPELAICRAALEAMERWSDG